MSLRRDESADHVIRTSIGWYEAGALSLTANSKKICPPQWYRLAAAVLLQHAVILFILLPNAHLLTIGYRPEFTTVKGRGLCSAPAGNLINKKKKVQSNPLIN